MCPESTWAESAVHDNKSVHVCCALLPCQVPLSSHAVSRPDKRRVTHDRESRRPMSSTNLVSRSTVSQHACTCSCLVSVTCSLSLFLGTAWSTSPGSFCRKISLPSFVLEIFPPVALRDSATWTGPACVGYSTECGWWVLSCPLKTQPPPSDARHRVGESAASPPAPRVGSVSRVKIVGFDPLSLGGSASPFGAGRLSRPRL